MKKNIVKIIITTVIIICPLGVTFAQTSDKEITDKFFEIYKLDPMKGIDYAFSTNKWFDNQKEGITNIKSKLKTLIDACGEYYGYELLAEKSAGTSIKTVSFIARYDREPIRFTFLLYKAKETWKVSNFSYDEEIDEELEEAVKAYRLKENK